VAVATYLLNEKRDAVAELGERLDGKLTDSPAENVEIIRAELRAVGRHPKIRIIKFRRRKHHQKQMGHRQHYTEIAITGIGAP
jgi:ribosomal protein L21